MKFSNLGLCLRPESAGIRGYHIATNNTAHGILARACLTVMVLSQLDEKVNRKRLPSSYPLVFYAAQYWVSHARSDGVEPQVL